MRARVVVRPGDHRSRVVLATSLLTLTIVLVNTGTAIGRSSPGAPPPQSMDVASLKLEAVHTWRSGHARLNSPFYLRGSFWAQNPDENGDGGGKLLQLDGTSLANQSTRSWDCLHALPATDTYIWVTNDGCSVTSGTRTYPYDPITDTYPWGSTGLGDVYDLTLDNGVIYAALSHYPYEIPPPMPQAYSAADGSLIWANSDLFISYALDPPPTVSESGGLVYAYDPPGQTLLVLDASDGSMIRGITLGQFRFRGDGLFVSDGIAFLGGTPDSGSAFLDVLAIDGSTADLLWTAPRALLVGTDGPNVILETPNGLKEVAGATRKMVWKHRASSPRTTTLSDGILWLSRNKVDRLLAIDAATGAVLRTFRTNTDHPTVLTVGGRLYVIDRDRIRLFA